MEEEVVEEAEEKSKMRRFSDAGRRCVGIVPGAEKEEVEEGEGRSKTRRFANTGRRCVSVALVAMLGRNHAGHPHRATAGASAGRRQWRGTAAAPCRHSPAATVRPPGR